MWGLEERVERVVEGRAITMAHGTMYGGWESSGDVCEYSGAVIVEEVGKGGDVRMAWLYLLLGGAGSQAGGD
mgnify:CR=1 FL=1